MREKTMEQEEKELYCLAVLEEIAPEVCSLIQTTARPIDLAKLSEILYTGLEQTIQERYRELQQAAVA